MHWEGHPEQKTDFQVVRNAPGLFAQSAGTVRYALAVHEDGSPVSPDSPARPQEVVSLFGTGFGPYQGQVPDGFAVPDSLVLALADPVSVLIADLLLDPVFAGAAKGEVGLVAVSFRVPESASGPIQLRVRVNKKKSNVVVLPVE